IGSPSAALSLDTWYRVEYLVNDTPASGSRVISAQLDGSTFASSSTSTSTYSVNWFGIGVNMGLSPSSTVVDYYADDIAINDATGSAQTSYPGEGKVVSLRPVGAGDSLGNAFVDGDGGGGANYTHVDE